MTQNTSKSITEQATKVTLIKIRYETGRFLYFPILKCTSGIEWLFENEADGQSLIQSTKKSNRRLFL